MGLFLMGPLACGICTISLRSHTSDVCEDFVDSHLTVSSFIHDSGFGAQRCLVSQYTCDCAQVWYQVCYQVCQFSGPYTLS